MECAIDLSEFTRKLDLVVSRFEAPEYSNGLANGVLPVKPTDLTPEELEILWKIEQWVNTKLPQQCQQAGKARPNWLVNVLATPGFERDTKALGVAATQLPSSKERIVIIPRSLLPLWNNKYQQAKAQPIWNQFLEENSKSSNDPTVVLARIAEVAKNMTTENKQILLQGCLESLQTWRFELPETIEEVREVVHGWPLKTRMQRAVESCLVQLTTKKQLKATLAHEYGHLFYAHSAQKSKSFDKPVMWLLGCTGVLLTTGIVVHLLGYSSLLYSSTFLACLSILQVLGIGLAEAQNGGFQAKRNELEADEFMHDLSRKNCEHLGHMAQSQFVFIELMANTPSTTKKKMTKIVAYAFFLPHLIIHAVARPFAFLARSVMGIKSPEAIVSGGHQWYCFMPHLESATRWEKCKQWSKKYP